MYCNVVNDDELKEDDDGGRDDDGDIDSLEDVLMDAMKTSIPGTLD